MNTDYNSYMLTEEATIILDIGDDVSVSQNHTLNAASKDVSGDNGIAAADWQAGFMLGDEGNEIVENVTIEAVELLDDVPSLQVIENGEDDLLYVEEEERFVKSLTFEQSADNGYFDADAFVLPSNVTEPMSVFVAELEPFFEYPAEDPINLDAVFDAFGVSANRISDESLYFNDLAEDNSFAAESNHPFGEEISAKLFVSFTDFDVGKVIDQMADQMIIYNES